MSEQQEEPTPKEMMEALRKINERLETFLGEEQEGPRVLSAEEQAYQTKWLSAEEGHNLGRQVVAHFQRFGLDFMRAVAQRTLVGVNAQGTFHDWWQLINPPKFPTRFVLASMLVVVMFAVFMNSPYSAGLAPWLGQGYNAYIVMVFVVVIFLLLAMAMRRRGGQAKPSPIGGM